MSASPIIQAPLQAECTARANIALIKYWGKRDRAKDGGAALNLPAVGSLSITLDALSTRTRVRFDDSLDRDVFRLNDREADTVRLTGFLDLFRVLAGQRTFAHVESDNNFPTGAGLASSASGFAALAAAAARALGIDVPDSALSALARQGSGSAARSIFGGFVEWHRGIKEDGSDSFAEQLVPENHWPLRVVIAVTDEGPKSTGSTDGMTRTEFTSPYFDAWVEGQEHDLAEARAAVFGRDFEKLADVSEYSCLKMHASAMAARPGVMYWNGATIEAMNAVRTLRAKGVAVFFTIDAGPQLKAVCLPESEAAVRETLLAVDGVKRVIGSGLGEGVEVKS
ncbi:MAG: diphosphomevalonate decarboxylase [Proteobacteria bacterium]|nr:diphosphomevalonate decarboxylase [Pseudomonadota bacterium]